MSLYVTVNEFKQAPTAIDTSQLDQTNLGNQAAQDASLLNVLRRASAWVDNICRVNTLEATLTTETKEVNMLRDGRITVHVDNTPIVSLQSVQYRLNPLLSYTTIDPSFIQAFNNWFSVYQFSQTTLSPNLILQPNQIGYLDPYKRQNLSNMPITIQYSYINGYMNTSLNGAVVAGATQITVQDSTGAYPGLNFTLFDGASEEYLTISSVNGNVITLTKPLIFNHADKTPASAVPQEIKQATILLASYLIKNRGAMAVTMGEVGVQGMSQFTQSNDLDTAKQMLKPYIRMVIS